MLPMPEANGGFECPARARELARSVQQLLLLYYD